MINFLSAFKNTDVSYFLDNANAYLERRIKTNNITCVQKVLHEKLFDFWVDFTIESLSSMMCACEV